MNIQTIYFWEIKNDQILKEFNKKSFGNVATSPSGNDDDDVKACISERAFNKISVSAT